MSDMRVLDLFCGQGGASAGYYMAGFQPVGVDLDPVMLARYPFAGHQMDWREGLEKFGPDADLIHASPPCQAYSRMSNCRPGLSETYPRLIESLRELLAGKAYVIENVVGAPLHDPVRLCGCMWGLGAEHKETTFMLYRPRLFETSFAVPQPAHQPHVCPAMPMYGHAAPGWFYRRYGHGLPASVLAQATGTPWMSGPGRSEAIPPAFTHYVAQCYLTTMSRSPIVAA